MNDYSELEHGLDCLAKAYDIGPGGAKFRAILDRIHPDATKEIERGFGGMLPKLRAGTFLSCFSEHSPALDRYGRLSMWRAYGGGAGVALILRTERFFAEDTAVLQAFTTPVVYLEENEFDSHLRTIADGIERESQFLKTIKREALIELVLHMFRFAIASTKHPAFREELEWRLIYSPAFQVSKYLLGEIQTISGIPQKIYKIPLKNVAADGLHGIEIPDLVEKVIIGPCNYPRQLATAIVEALEAAGVSDPTGKVLISNIPLRS